MKKLINSYCREAGVRNLQQQIEKVYRKVAYKIVNKKEGALEIDKTTNQLRSVSHVDGDNTTTATATTTSTTSTKDKDDKEPPSKANEEEPVKIEIRDSDLEEYLGKPPYSTERHYPKTPPGVVMGLAWTSMGGSTPYIETVLDRYQFLKVRQEKLKQRRAVNGGGDGKKRTDGVGGNGKLVATGQLGDVMKESGNIAYTYAKVFWDNLQRDEDLLHKLEIKPPSKPSTSAMTATTSNGSASEDNQRKKRGRKGKDAVTDTNLSQQQQQQPSQHQQNFDEDSESGLYTEFFNDALLHMHLPEGSTPKDGPSAGISMVTSLLSLAMDKPVRQDMAMTGEITLTGKVLPVGGIREKVIAARRANVKCLVFPLENKKDWHELPEYIRTGLEVHFANYYRDVFEVAFVDNHTSDSKSQ